MSTTTTLIVAVFSMFMPKDISDCEAAYQNATSGYQHLKKSMQANNLDHIKLYADRAISAIEKADSALKNCGCTAAEDASYTTLDHLSKALEKETFERSRYHASKAKVSAQLIITSLDVCGENGLLSTIDEEEETLLSQEEALLAQQKRLLEEQKKLEEQIRKQKELQQRLASEKKEKLAQQLAIKSEAEASLSELKTAISNVTKSLECSTVDYSDLSPFTRSEEALEAETVQATRLFYAQRTEEMVQRLLETLEKCE
ncbi:hypothetical protein POV27_19470 [Aureisphaera galaxeae]|uniref:hypothetical protein n=1 Tax=Aureisphaera galaxeae TaxID=1538023 RepID=UPI00234FD11E|nr:hypothetical protein [Aureisphaera galaxeae]MDC8006242.1 hypothetical protein [Aureisphaera galaxeae]